MCGIVGVCSPLHPHDSHFPRFHFQGFWQAKSYVAPDLDVEICCANVSETFQWQMRLRLYKCDCGVSEGAVIARSCPVAAEQTRLHIMRSCSYCKNGHIALLRVWRLCWDKCGKWLYHVLWVARSWLYRAL